MRKKEDSVLISFGTTAQAMAMEECCRRDGMPGRLIPIPSFVSAGCGVGWKAPAVEAENLLNYMDRQGLGREAVGFYLL